MKSSYALGTERETLVTEQYAVIIYHGVTIPESSR